MKCPACPDVTLAMSSRNGIEIDYCPTCRGVWLDRGELDKIIEQSKPEPVAVAPTHAPMSQPDYRYRDDYRYKKRKSFLEELFD